MKNKNTKNKDLYLSILNMFVSADNSRTPFLTPFVIDDLAFASDLHVGVYFDKNLIDPIESFTGNNSKGVVQTLLKKKNKNTIFEIKDLEDKLKEGTIINLYDEENTSIECTSCDGTGEVEWEFEHYTKDFECPVCDGIGATEESIKSPTYKKGYAYKEVCHINDSCFSLELFSKIVKVAQLLEQKTIVLEYQDLPNSLSVFSVKDTKIVIMPRLKDPDDKVVFSY